MGGEEQILGGVNLRCILLVQKDAKNQTEVVNPLYPIVTQCYPYMSLDVGVFPTSKRRPSDLHFSSGVSVYLGDPGISGGIKLRPLGKRILGKVASTSIEIGSHQKCKQNIGSGMGTGMVCVGCWL